MEKRILIRVDASNKIGIGHLKRCLKIAEILKTKNIIVVFLSKFKNIENNIPAKGIEVILLKQDSSVEDELSIIKNLISNFKVNIILLDINNYQTFSGLDSYVLYLKRLKDLSLFIVSFEDFKVHPFISDIVIIPYVGAEKINYQNEKNCKCLFGAKYFILRNEFLKVKHVKIRKKCENILITMGGADPKGITLKVLEALNYSELNINLNVIIGSFSNITDVDINNTLNNYTGSYSINRTVNNMAKIMSRSDIAIVSSGLTVYETSAIGLPSIVISLNKYHSAIMEDFTKLGSVVHLGHINGEIKTILTKCSTDLLNNYEKRLKMSEAGKLIIDGKGIERIISEISKVYKHA